MKHYLNLVPISAKIHCKQSKMTRICITLAVFLVAVMFGLADMYLQGVIQKQMLEIGIISLTRLIITIVLLTSLFAVRQPAMRLHKMSIVANISAQ